MSTKQVNGISKELPVEFLLSWELNRQCNQTTLRWSTESNLVICTTFIPYAVVLHNYAITSKQMLIS